LLAEFPHGNSRKLIIFPQRRKVNRTFNRINHTQTRYLQPMKKFKTIISSTNVDSQNEQMSLEALQKMAKVLNGNRKPRLGIQHDMSVPPLGRMNQGTIEKRDDGIYLLVGFQEFFNKKEEIYIDNKKYFLEYFENENFSFAECEKIDSTEKLVISVDIHNFENLEEVNVFFESIEKASNVEFHKERHSRKAAINDPQIIYQLAESSIYAYWGFKFAKSILKKTSEKLVEKISDELVKLYETIKVSSFELIKKSIPKNRPITHIIEFPSDIKITLIMTDKSPEVIVNSINKSQIIKLQSKIKNLITLFKAEKIQFILNENEEWELNYCLTKDGKSIGSEKAIKKRDSLYQNLIDNNNAIYGSISSR